MVKQSKRQRVTLDYHLDNTNWLPLDYMKRYWGLRPPEEDDEDEDEDEV